MTFIIYFFEGSFLSVAVFKMHRFYVYQNRFDTFGTFSFAVVEVIKCSIYFANFRSHTPNMFI